MPHTSTYVFDSEQKGRPQGSGIAWAPTDLSKFGDLNRLVLAGLTLKSTRRASGALVVRERGRECPLMAQSGHDVLHCTCLLLTQSVLIADIGARRKIALTEMETRYETIGPFHRTAIAENRSAEMPDVQSWNVAYAYRAGWAGSRPANFHMPSVRVFGKYCRQIRLATLLAQHFGT